MKQSLTRETTLESKALIFPKTFLCNFTKIYVFDIARPLYKKFPKILHFKVKPN